jgi:uncharacterized protein YceK
MTSIVLLAMITVRLTACGISLISSGTKFYPGTQAGTYTITVNDMQGSARITSTVTLKVV